MKQVVVKLSFIMVLLITTVSIATPTHWRTLEPGLEYTKINQLSGFHTGHIHAFRIDLNHFQLKLAIAEDQRNKIATVHDLAVSNQALVGINGGFFSQELKPLGLRISDGVVRSPLKATAWWGVFYILHGSPAIVSQKAFQLQPQIKLAVQSGPRLVTNGNIPVSLKTGTDSRTALGITRDKKVIMVVTEELALTTTELAKIMQAAEVDGGLACINALNLDGGSSTQLYAKVDHFSVDVSGFGGVTDAIIVVPR